ncbi:MAG: hypothetical protein WEB06_15185 [Actinomycetota bacterium]
MIFAGEPENRLVARNLEARWETRLVALADTERALTEAGVGHRFDPGAVASLRHNSTGSMTASPAGSRGSFAVGAKGLEPLTSAV